MPRKVYISVWCILLIICVPVALVIIIIPPLLALSPDQGGNTEWLMLTLLNLIALIIAIVGVIGVIKNERIRKKERMQDALARCHTLLEEAIRVHPSLDTKLAFVFPDGFADDINKKADALTEKSWICTDLGDDIRQGASTLKSSVLVTFPDDDGYLSNKERTELLEKIKDLKDKIAEHLKELNQ